MMKFSLNKSSRAFLLLGVILGQVFGGEAIVPPEGGRDVIAFSRKGEVRLSQKAGEARSKWVAIDEMSFEKAHQVEVIKSPKAAKDLQLVVPLRESFKKGDSVLVSF
jgi:hypothetical protein